MKLVSSTYILYAKLWPQIFSYTIKRMMV